MHRTNGPRESCRSGILGTKHSWRKGPVSGSDRRIPRLERCAKEATADAYVLHPTTAHVGLSVGHSGDMARPGRRWPGTVNVAPLDMREAYNRTLRL